MEEYEKIVPFEELKGQILEKIEISRDEDSIKFITKENTYLMIHERDCCLDATIEDICGEIKNLIGSPILRAEERSNVDLPPKEAEYAVVSFTWTFYELATIKGAVTIRWYGESNGYYSEGVDFWKMKKK